MKKEFVPYDLALELRKLGFDEPCFAYYSSDGDYILGIDEVRFDTISTYDQNSNLGEDSNACTTPLFQQTFRFFREKYGLISEIIWMTALPTHNTFSARIKSSEKTEYMKECDTYEESELDCLRKLIEIVKGK